MAFGGQKRPFSKKTENWFLNTYFRLMQVKSIAECSSGSILQYFRPSLNYHLSLRFLFCLFLSGRFTQVLLYVFVAMSGHIHLKKVYVKTLYHPYQL